MTTKNMAIENYSAPGSRNAIPSPEATSSTGQVAQTIMGGKSIKDRDPIIGPVAS
jgi:hypothetical protein